MELTWSKRSRGPARVDGLLVFEQRIARGSDVHAAAEQLLGQPLKWTSVKATLAEHAGTSESRFERVSRGRYRLADGSGLAQP